MIKDQAQITNYFINRMPIGASLFYLFLLILYCAITFSCSKNTPQHWQSKELKLLGTTVRVQVNHEDANIRAKAINSVITEFARIESKFSPFKQSSEISNINSNGYEKDIPISEEMMELLSFSFKISELTDGAFDVTFASVGHLYDFREKTAPTRKQFNDGFKGVNFKNIILGADSVRLSHQNTKISFGGFAKGYAVKKSIEIIKSYGIKNGLVTAGGDSMVIGLKNGTEWKTGIKAPRGELRAVYSFPLTNKAISTSGDYERFFENNGEKIHHIINPNTGKSAQDIQSVTVIGTDPMVTDALSTSMFVLGIERAMSLCERSSDIDALIIDKSGDIYKSSGFPDHQKFD